MLNIGRRLACATSGGSFTRSFARALYGEATVMAATKSHTSTLAAWMMSGSPLMAENLASLGFDAIVCDFQHGTGDRVPMFQAIAAATVPPGMPRPEIIARVSKLCDAEIALALDGGATSLICPMINSVGEAEALVRAAHFPPHGRRSFGPHRTGWLDASLTPGDWVRAQNEAVKTYAMIETRGALEELESILAVPRLSGVFIGPNDLGLVLGHDPSSAPSGEVLRTVETILATAHAAGKQAGIFCADAATCRRMAHKGFDLVSVGADLGWMRSAAAAALKVARE